ncbi:hypothetical protein BC938DRAFT_483789, partial [Jimgerdemannia flammicorona]
YKSILSNTIFIEKAKLLAEGLEIPIRYLAKYKKNKEYLSIVFYINADIVLFQKYEYLQSVNNILKY